MVVTVAPKITQTPPITHETMDALRKAAAQGTRVELKWLYISPAKNSRPVERLLRCTILSVDDFVGMEVRLGLVSIPDPLTMYFKFLNTTYAIVDIKPLGGEEHIFHNPNIMPLGNTGGFVVMAKDPAAFEMLKVKSFGSKAVAQLASTPEERFRELAKTARTMPPEELKAAIRGIVGQGRSDNAVEALFRLLLEDAQ